jgi:FkbM family methyltransferase
VESAKVYIEAFAATKDFKLLLHSIFSIMDRRLHISVPVRLQSVLLNSSCSEPYLEKYMDCSGSFIDVGANVGVWTLYMAKKGIKVYAFEPNPKSFNFLKGLSKRYSNIVLFPYALGERNYTARLKLHSSSGHDSLIIEHDDFTGNHILVTVRSLDSFDIQNVGLIKVDTEGYEAPVLLGARRTIEKSKPRLIIEVHEPYPEQRSKIKKILTMYGYHCISLVTHIIGDPYKR